MNFTQSLYHFLLFKLQEASVFEISIKSDNVVTARMTAKTSALHQKHFTAIDT